MRIKVLFCAAFILLASSAFADTITLKSGKEIEGTILERNNEKVVIDFLGTKLTYFSDAIEKINGEPINAVNGEVIVPAPQAAAAPANPFETPKAQEAVVEKTEVPVTPAAIVTPPIQEPAAPALEPAPALSVPESAPIEPGPAPVSEPAPTPEAVVPASIDLSPASSAVVSAPEPSLASSSAVSTVETAPSSAVPTEPAPAQKIEPAPPKITEAAALTQHSVAEKLNPQLKDKGSLSIYSRIHGLWAILGPFIVLIIFLALVVYAYFALCLQLIANKLQEAKAWWAWVPIAHVFLMCKLAGMNYWWLLLFLAPIIPFVGSIASAVFSIYLWYRIIVVLNRPSWHVIFMILPIANIIYMGHLAFAKE